MFKIALCGKANSGKNTTANLIIKSLKEVSLPATSSSRFYLRAGTIAFADPIKEIIKIMFPKVKPRHLYGASKFRNTVIEGAQDKEGNSLTIRRALIEIGTGMGRGMKDSVWLDVFDHRFSKLVKKRRNAVVVTDVRFRNEFDHLKNNGFFIIRINRDDGDKINHSSETNQESIRDNEFNYVLDNNGTLEQLTNTIQNELMPLVIKMQSP